MLNLFDAEHPSLVNLASGAVLEDDIADHVLDAEKQGEKQFFDFVKTKATFSLQSVETRSKPSLQ